jgi:oligopeptide/dipeptide ABC transporter ATP-binding protein
VLNLNRPTAGNVRYRGRDLASCTPADWRRLRRQVQYIFQDPLASLDPRMRVLDQVIEVLAVHDIGPPAERRDRALAELAAVGLDPDLAANYPHALSGGQRQRAVIARALALDPKLLICDEPVSALDVSIQAQVVNLLAELRRARGLALLFISHDLSLVRHLCERVAIMYMGRIVEQGRVEQILDRPLHPYTRALVAAIPRAEPRRGEPPEVIEGETPSLLDPPAGCRFHPRCPRAIERCAAEAPLLTAQPDGRLAACHRL